MAASSTARRSHGAQAAPAAVVITHPPLAPPTLVDGGVAGASAGDQRFWSFTGTTRSGDAVPIDWVMQTTLVSADGSGDERRLSNAVFTLDPPAGDQVVLNGVAVYAGGNSTLQPESTVVRAITGGTGRYNRADGQVFSQRYADGSWSHALLFGSADVIVGDNRNNELRPGKAPLSCLAGLEGADRFVFAEPRGGARRAPDLITDFDPEQGDTIAFRQRAYPGLDRIKLQRVDDLHALGRSGGGGASIVFERSTGSIWLDLNGEAEGWGVGGGPVVEVSPGLSISRAAFELI